MEIEKTKIKYIKEEEFLSYLDWLTRFKNPINNLLRVSEKLIARNLIFPKYNAKKISELSFFEKIELAQYIWNKSIENLLGIKKFKNFKLKEFLLYEEEQTFNETYLLEQIKTLEYKSEKKLTNYKKIRNELFFHIDDLVEHFKILETQPEYLKRLIEKKSSQLSNEELFTIKSNYASIKLLFLVEGITEEKLFPVFAHNEGFELNNSGIKLKSAGGKTHLVKYYADIRKLLKIPVFILLDADGNDVIEDLNNILEKKDSVYLIKKGEIEDILPHELILKAINNYYETQGSISLEELAKNEPMTKILYNLFKEKGFGEFQKAKFAQILLENINSKEDTSDEIKTILNLIRNR